MCKLLQRASGYQFIDSVDSGAASCGTSWNRPHILSLWNWRLRMTSIRQRAIDGITVGDEFSVSRTFTEQDMLQFADVSRDYNPIHLEDRFAKAKKFKGRICHGLLVGSMLTEIGGQIGVLASHMDFVFKKPVYFGDTVTCRWTFTEVDEKGRAKAQVVFQNQDEIVVLTATVKGIIPGIRERAILQAMIEEGDPTNQLSAKGAKSDMR
jgi:3-hydroxybutyryl-CoA dehydratase